MATVDDLVLTEGGCFLATDAQGEVDPGRPGTHGLFARDTRFLSGLAVRVQGGQPSLLSVDDGGYTATLTYDALPAQDRGTNTPAQVILRRERFLEVAHAASPPTLHERLTFTSFGRAPLDLEVQVALRADFADIFRVRGFADAPTGTYAPVAHPRASEVVLGYTGRDDVRRAAVCRVTPEPAGIDERRGEGTGADLRFALHLGPRQPATIDLTVACVEGDAAATPNVPAFAEGRAAIRAAHRHWRERECTRIETDHAALNAVIAESVRSLRLLLLEPPTGPYVAAGIPWFAVPFGRDGLITALQLLSVNPTLAVGTLRYLAAHQGRDYRPDRDEEPGKIMHEMRSGEAVRTGVAPFGPYYGTVDATPIFLVLLGRTWRWLGDEALLRELEPAARAALGWLDGPGDPDGDGLIEFARRAGRGLDNQGWKDSSDSLQFPDGSYAQAPIALVEVQGYAYEARLAGAMLLERLGDPAAAADQRTRAAALRDLVGRCFWLPDERCLAQALDAQKAAIPAVTSNAGHCLWSAVLAADQADAVARRLSEPDMVSGWGLRTLSSAYPSFNPLSYHNGSVWPHDTSIVVAGLKRAGHDAAAADIFAQVIDAAQGYRSARLPELYCGLSREPDERGPVPYPVSCSPQAWAAASVFLMLQSILGLEPDAAAGVVHLRPFFPAGLGTVALRGMRLGGAVVDLEVRSDAGGEVAVRLDGKGSATATATGRAGEALTVPIPQGERPRG